MKLAIPRLLVVTVEGEMVSLPPRLDARDTTLLGTTLPLTSLIVTTTKAEAKPFATTDDGEAVTFDWVVLMDVKVTNAFSVITKLPSVVSVAVKEATPEVADVTVNVTTPDDVDDPEAAEIVSTDPVRFEANVTVLLGSALLYTSSSVTVMVEVANPLSSTAVGEATTVDWEALVDPGFQATATVFDNVI